MQKKVVGWLKLIAFFVFGWFFLFVFTPFWVSYSPIHQHFFQTAEENDIPVGALYYNDLPFINDAAMILRDTWRFRHMNPSQEMPEQTQPKE